MKSLLVGLVALCLTSISFAGGYTGNEIQHTQIYDEDYTSGVSVLRRYYKGAFIEGELFNNKDAIAGIGYQYGDKNTILDLRVNKNNIKIFIMQRF